MRAQVSAHEPAKSVGLRRLARRPDSQAPLQSLPAPHCPTASLNSGKCNPHPYTRNTHSRALSVTSFSPNRQAHLATWKTTAPFSPNSKPQASEPARPPEAQGVRKFNFPRSGARRKSQGTQRSSLLIVIGCHRYTQLLYYIILFPLRHHTGNSAVGGQTEQFGRSYCCAPPSDPLRMMRSGLSKYFTFYISTNDDGRHQM